MIPKALQADVLALAHEGHLGIAGMWGQLRKSVWYLGMTVDIEEFIKMCSLGCVAAIPRNVTLPMAERETPERPWQRCSADYKGPIGGKYYFHVLIDNYSRWLEVDMMTSTSMEKLYKVLDRSRGVHGVTEIITHDNGPP